jgi:DNA topoisomerase-3
MVEKLLRNGRIRLKDCKSQKTGKTYNADLLLSTEDDGRAVFSMEFEKGGGRNERKKRT